MSLTRYQLAVVGAGSAGLASAVLAAELGARVALIERHRLGGDRLSYRLPAAALIQAARACRQRRVPAPGVRAEPADVDVAAVLKRARRLRSGAAAGDGAESLGALGVDVIFGEARFVAADALEVDNRRLEFRRAVIATGARTAVPKIAGLDKVAFHTPETLFELTDLPPRLGILGAGSRGCEIGQAFAVLGSEVHLFVAGDRLLTGRDPDAAALVAEAMRRDGVELHLNSRELTLRRDGGGARVTLPDGGGEIAVDALLVATGPLPNVERLGLEAAGVVYDLSGVEVDRHLRTSNRRIFAAGGVVSSAGNEANKREDAQGGQAPDADARVAVRNALLFRRLDRRRRTVPRATYTWPEIARVGIGADEASSPKIETLTVSLAEADRGELFGGEGFLRLHVKRRGGEVLGGTLVADRAAELIGPLAMAVGGRQRLGVFADVPLPHPTRGEIYRRAAFAWRRQQQALRHSAPGLIGFWLKLRSRF